MYCIFAQTAIKAMNGNRGKMATQSGHAYLHANWDAQDRFPEAAAAYRDDSHVRKITCVVEDVEALIRLRQAYRGICGVSLVTDAGFTVFEQPTTTALGIGPLRDDQIGDDLKTLKLFL